MKQVLLLLCACMTLATTKAQVNHKDKALGWSVTLPDGWAKTTNTPADQSDIYTYNSKESTWVAFKNSDSTTLKITQTKLLPKYNNKPTKALKQKQKDSYLKKTFKGLGYDVKASRKKTTIAGKTCYTTSYHLARNGKTSYIEIYHWANNTHMFTLAKNYRQDPPNAKTKAILDKAVADIFSSL